MNPRLLERLLDPAPLSRPEIRTVVSVLTDAMTSDSWRAAGLVALTSRRPRTDEVRTIARNLRSLAVSFPGARQVNAVDLCGCGGAKHPTYNISTVSAFVVRGAGTPVVKHGNRSARGHTGSSDLLEALGLPVTRSRAFAIEAFRRHRIAFLHAPLFHPATQAVGKARKEIGIPTVFNLIGPLTNPARPRVQLVGCPAESVARLMTTVLPSLGVDRGAAFTSPEGADELSPRRPTRLLVWNRDHQWSRRVDPLEYLDADDRRGSWDGMHPAAAAEEASRILAGGSGARRGSILLTAGTVQWLRGSASTLREGVEQAQASIDSGAAAAVLENLTELADSHIWGDGTT